MSKKVVAELIMVVPISWSIKKRFLASFSFTSIFNHNGEHGIPGDTEKKMHEKMCDERKRKAQAQNQQSF